MKTPESTVETIMNLIEDGKFIFIKCEDDSEKFLHKEDGWYCVSNDNTFEHNTYKYRDKEPVKECLDSIRGYGEYEPIDYAPMQVPESCGCDS